MVAWARRVPRLCPPCALALKFRRDFGRDGLRSDLAGSVGSRTAQTRVSLPSTATAPPTVIRCATSKLERRNSLTCDVISTTSPNFAGARKRAPASTSGMPMMPNAFQVRRFDAQRQFEQRPGAPIEEFEEAGVEDDARWVAMAPFDGELPAIDQSGHAPTLEHVGLSWKQWGFRSSPRPAFAP